MSDDLICQYSDLPSPMAYVNNEQAERELLSPNDIDRIIEMAWEDRTPFDAIKNQFGLNEQAVRNLMKRELKSSSYKKWRIRVEACQTKHLKKRSSEINRFKCNRQRQISGNRLSKR